MLSLVVCNFPGSNSVNKNSPGGSSAGNISGPHRQLLTYNGATKEEALKFSGYRLGEKKAEASSYGPIKVFDVDGKYSYRGDILSTMIEYRVEEMVGSNIQDVVKAKLYFQPTFPG